MLVDEKGIRMMSADQGAMHYIIEGHLLDYRVKYLNLVAPRGTAKSTLVAVNYSLFHCFLEKYNRQMRGFPYDERQRFVLIMSKTEKSAQQRLSAIKACLGEKVPGGEVYSKNFRRLFGNWGYTTARTWQTNKIVLKDGTIISSTSLGGQVHGLNELGVRPTLVIFDDPEDENNTKTPQSIVSNRKILMTGLLPGLDEQFGRLILIGTPQCQACMVDFMHNVWSDDDDPLTFSMWFRQKVSENISMHTVPQSYVVRDDDKYGRKIMEDDMGRWLVYPNLLWPQYQTMENLMAKKRSMSKDPDIGPGGFTRAHECYMIAEEEKVFDPKWFDQTWEGEYVIDSRGERFLKITRRGDEVFQTPEYVHVGVTIGYDPAYTVNAWSSHTAACVIATDDDENRYELDWIYDKVLAREMLVKFKALQDKYMPNRSMSEANGPQVAHYHRMLEHGIIAGPDKMAQERSKMERIEQLQAPMVEGKYYFRPLTPARKEGRVFPKGSCDYLDAMEKADRIKLRGFAKYKFIDRDPRKQIAPTYRSAMTV